jgi:hypothetical protein
VVKGADEGELLVVEAIRVEQQLGAALPAAEEEDLAAGADELDGVGPRLLGASGLDHEVGALPVSGSRAEIACQLLAFLAAADNDHVGARILGGRAEHQPDRPGADHCNGLAGLDPRAGDAVETAGERLEECSDLGGEARRHGQQVPLGDVRRDEHILRIGAVQEWIEVGAELLLPTAAGRAVAARGRVRRRDTTAGGDVHAAELVAEAAGQLAEQDGMAALKRLRVGPVCQRELDLDDDVARLRLRFGDLLEPEVAWPVEEERPHGV